MRAVGNSRWAVECRGERWGPLPALDLAAHRRLLELVRGLVVDGVVVGVHDVSDGGLALALAELAVASGVGLHARGAAVADHVLLFSESPSRAVVCVAPGENGERAAAELRTRAAGARVPVSELGAAGGERLVIGGLVDVGLEQASEAWRGAIPAALG